MTLKEILFHLRDKFLAGRASFEPDEEEILFGEFTETLKTAADENIFYTLPEISELFYEVFEAAIHAQLSKDLMQFIPTDIYFSFGKNISLFKQIINKNLIHSYLDHFRYSQFLKRIYGESRWQNLIEELIRKSNFNIRILFERHKSEYGSKPLFKVLSGQSSTDYSWNDCDKMSKDYSAAFINILQETSEPESMVAFLMENDLHTALLDIACLTSGLVNVIIPANSVSQHIEFILNQTKAPVVVVYDEKQLIKIKSIRNDLKYLKKIILFKGTSADDMVVTFHQFISGGKKVEEEILTDIKNKIKIDDLATIMYTSGTTGEPKGIMFSNMNIVFKRFCRAMAIPGINDEDKYLAYLPLYHTFGRWLEMIGSIFWGAEYSFMENPSVETMLLNMQMVKPSILISIPKKWSQIYEAITNHVDVELDDEKKILKTVNSLTGGNLKWGLSAAGFLPPDIFQFFQKYRIELMSGFGMTEATGGISMTPPGKYIQNSLGKALPGIEIKLGEDGELLIRGSYVMLGYYGQNHDVTFLQEGWLPTGDIMKMDDNGFVEIVDRKKEIYKNVKGETIAPQRIENFFRDFENVKQVFLVGDHRPFNTILIYPNFETGNNLLKKMPEEQMHNYFSSVIVTVNNFLAPFERIVDFRLIDRPFRDDLGELTPKGTYKRRIIETHFTRQIEEMYLKDHTSLKVNGVEIRIPNWFLREKGLLSGEISANENGIIIPKLNQSLIISVSANDKSIIRVGDFNYTINARYLELQTLLINPFYWLGNKNLLNFTGDAIYGWYRQHSGDEKLSYHSSATAPLELNSTVDFLKSIYEKGEYSLHGLSLAVLLLQSKKYDESLLAVNYLRMLLDNETPVHSKFALNILYRPNLSNDLQIRREMFISCLKLIRGNSFKELLELYIENDYNFLSENVIMSVVELSHGADNLEAIEKVLARFIRECESSKQIEQTPVPSLFNLLSYYGIQHPTVFKRIRQSVLHFKVKAEMQELWVIADQTQFKLRDGFRNWLGANQTVTVDIETGEEYHWKDVISFEPDIDESDKNRIREGIISSPILREAVFLFSGGTLITLNNILPGGIWVSKLSETPTRSVYRVSIQTRFQGAFDITLKINKCLPRDEMLEELGWLIVAGSQIESEKIVDDFGGYWEDQELWTEEFVPGDNVEKLLQREIKKRAEPSEPRAHHLWPFFVWNAASVYYSFWKTTGYKYQIAEPSPAAIIIPAHDYQNGSRLISIEERINSNSLAEFIMNFNNSFILYCEKEHNFPRWNTIWNFVFAGIVEVEGTKNGIEILKKLKDELAAYDVNNIIRNTITNFISHIEQEGFEPQQLYFATRRFHRWFEINRDAALTAQAEMLYELYETYHIYNLEEKHPERRTQFFLGTSFFNSDENIKKELKEIVSKQRKGKISKDELLRLISNIQNEFELSEEEKYFLTRLSFPHVKPTDTAVLLKTKSDTATAANLVVHKRDDDGNSFIIRNPISPKEISKLHQLFIETNLLVNFRPEHQYLVALSERGFIIGGLYYHRSGEESIHMEKIVVSNRYRRKGISEALMNELFNRLRDEHIKLVTTGFFRPEYFYRFDFKVERKYSGLVKKL